jgi:hypothetical protein
VAYRALAFYQYPEAAGTESQPFPLSGAVANPVMVNRSRFAAAWLVQSTRLLVLVGVAAVAITAGVTAGCRGLVIFGLANLVELIPSGLFAWRLQAEATGKEVDFAGPQRSWHRIASLAFLSVTALAVWMTLHQYEGGAHEKAAVTGIAGAVLAVVLVWFLTVLRSRIIGPAMSLTNADDAAATRVYLTLSVAVAFAFAAHVYIGATWADGLASVAVGVLTLRRAITMWTLT